MATLRDLQRRVHDEIPDRFRFPRILSVLALHEEVGELLGEFKQSAVPDRTSTEIAAEVGDVLLSCLEIANSYGLTIEPIDPIRVNIAQHRLSVNLYLAACAVSKECLDIEGFEQSHISQLEAALNRVVQSLAELAASWGVDFVAAFEEKFELILGFVADGTWESRYGNRLLMKRKKFD
ncbi:MAG TPA: MazG-like family protein [Candidatus Baltobacteraceae bacterium]|nr:MazG-like family protein [Candidatus Baltobacteraceae bacterium]